MHLGEGVGESCELPQRGTGGALAKNVFQTILLPQKWHLVTKFVFLLFKKINTIILGPFRLPRIARFVGSVVTPLNGVRFCT